jgi:hypothetical protein
MPLPRPSPTNLLGDPGYELDLLLDQYADEIEAATAALPGKLDATDAALGAAIAGASSKATPVDGDNLMLADSAASNVAKRFTWANLKSALQTALDGVFAGLAGVAGGQTLNGGTAASENLTLRSTAHATRGKVLFGTGAAYEETTTRLGVGTQSPAAELHVIATTEQLRLGYDTSNYETTTVSASGVIARAGNAGQWSFKAGVSSATLGSELITNGGYTSDLSGWTDSGSSWSWSAGTALHTAGSVSTLTQSVSVTSGATYQIALTITGRTTGSIGVALGSVPVIETGEATAFTATFTRSVVAGATGAVDFVITPTSDFNGAIDNVSVKAVTLGSVTPWLTVLDSASAVSSEMRGSTSALGNSAIGRDAQRSVTSGTDNVAVGAAAQYSITTGSFNTGIGRDAQRSLTTGILNSALGTYAQRALTSGSYNTSVGRDSQRSLTAGSNNTADGAYAQYSLTTGTYNTASGRDAQYSLTTGSTNLGNGFASQSGLTTGSFNVGIGPSAQRALTTASYNTAVGRDAQRYIANGSTGATTAENSVYIGASTKQSADSVTNENVFGYNATGIGSNSCVIGSSAVTKCQIYGDIILDKTVTAAGTTGAQTINKTVGSVNFAAAASSLVVTNSRVTTASVIIATVATNDTTMKSVVAVAASGSFTLTANAAATAETRVNFIVIN